MVEMLVPATLRTFLREAAAEARLVVQHRQDYIRLGKTFTATLRSYQLRRLLLLLMRRVRSRHLGVTSRQTNDGPIRA